jgi:glutamate synthase (NADPH/NADH) small chain
MAPLLAPSPDPRVGSGAGSFDAAARPAWFDDQLALLEAGRCLCCGGPLEPAPCSAACPAALDVPRFIDALARGSWEEAATAIFAENLLAASCALICPAEELCEGACILTRLGQKPIEINRLERYITDLAFQNPWAAFRTRAPATGKRVTVIGAGPAGLACAGELAALGHAVKLLESEGEFGGLLRHGLGTGRSPLSHLPDEVRAIIGLGVELYLDSPVDTPERLWQIESSSDAIFLGIGMEDADPPYPGDHLSGILGAHRFFEQVRRAPLTPGTRVAVLGGGNAAIDVARRAVRSGAGEVTVLYRRTEEETPAYRAVRAAARAEGIRFLRLTGPVRFLGTDRLNGIECRSDERHDEPGARSRPAGGGELILPVDLAVKALGREPRREFLRWVEGLDTEQWRPRVDPATGQTTNPKYFAGGSVVDGEGAVVAAVQAGKRAARGIDHWLSQLDHIAASWPGSEHYPPAGGRAPVWAPQSK